MAGCVCFKDLKTHLQSQVLTKEHEQLNLHRGNQKGKENFVVDMSKMPPEKATAEGSLGVNDSRPQQKEAGKLEIKTINVSTSGNWIKWDNSYKL